MAEPLPSLFDLLGKPKEEEDNSLELPSVLDILSPGFTQRLARGPLFKNVEAGQSLNRQIEGGLPTAEVPIPEGGVIGDTASGILSSLKEHVPATLRAVSQGLNSSLGSVVGGGGKLAADVIRPIAPGPAQAIEELSSAAAQPLVEAGQGRFESPENVERDLAAKSKPIFQQLRDAPVETMAGAASSMLPFIAAPELAPATMAAMGRQSGEESALAGGATPEVARVSGQSQAAVDLLVGDILPKRLASAFKGELGAGAKKTAIEAAKTLGITAPTGFGMTEAHQAIQKIATGAPMNHEEAVGEAVILSLLGLTGHVFGGAERAPERARMPQEPRSAPEPTPTQPEIRTPQEVTVPKEVTESVSPPSLSSEVMPERQAQPQPVSDSQQTGVGETPSPPAVLGLPSQGFGATGNIFGTGMSAVEKSLENAPRVNVDPLASPAGTQSVTKGLEKTWKVPLRTRMMANKKAQGEYHTQPEVIRLKQPGDIVTAAHETGHHIYKTYDLAAIQDPAVTAEMVKIGKELYPNATQSLLKNEGFAEFARLSWSGYDTSEIAPKLTEYWGNRLASERVLADRWNQSRGLFDRWRGQSPMQKAQGQINFSGKALDEPSIREQISEAKRQHEYAWVDRWAPIERATREILAKGGKNWSDLPASRNPARRLAAQEGTAPAVVRAAVFDGWSDPTTGEVMSPSLRDAFRPFSKKEYKDVMGYIFAKRTIELADRKPTIDERTGRERGGPKETGLSRESAQAIIEQYQSPEMENAARVFNAWGNGLVDWATKMEFISPETGERIKGSSLFYAPLLRVIESEQSRRPGSAARSSFKRLSEKGDTRPIEDPLYALSSMAEKIVTAAVKHRAARDLVDLATSTDGMGYLIEKVSPPPEVREVAVAQMKKDLLAMGFDEATIKKNEDSFVTAFFSPKSYHGPEDVIAIKAKGGGLDFYQIGDPLLATALEGNPGASKVIAGAARLPTVDKALRAGKRGFTLGATGLNAGFSFGTGLVRDIMDASVKGGVFVPGESVAGLAPKWRRLYREGGGEMFARISEDRQLFKDVRDDLLAHTKTQRLKLRARHPIEETRKFFGSAEGFARRGAFKRAFESTRKNGGTFEDALIAASEAGAESSVNFRRAGVEGRAVNQYVGFFNPAVQGVSRARKALFKDAETGAVTINGRTAARAFTMLTLPSLALWWKNKDEDWYKDRPLWEKATRLHITKDLMLPVPQELGAIFATGPIAVLEALRKRDPASFKRILPKIAAVFIPPVAPSLVKPWLDVALNKSSFGSPIETASMKRQLPEYRYAADTPAVYRKLGYVTGKLFGISPVQAKYLIETSSGGLLRDPISGLNFILSDKKEAADIPVVGRFIPRKNRTGDFITRLYEESDKGEQVYATIRSLEKEERWDEAKQLENDNAGLLGLDQTEGEGRDRYPRLFAIRYAKQEMKDVREADPDLYPQEATRIAQEVLEQEW